MAKVTIKRDGGLTLDVEMTVDELRQFIGVNGSNGHGSHVQTAAHGSLRPPPAKEIVRDVDAFFREVNNTERGAKFISAMRRHPNGVEASDLAPMLGLKDAKQIGGYTGGGLSKITAKHGIDMREIYTSEVDYPDGKRVRMFYPGSLLK